MATPANIRGRVEDWLARASTPAFSGYAMVAAFTAYFAMYAVRKPFAAAGFEGTQVLGIDLKIALVLGQVIGYALSKFLGIKFVSEIPPSRRPLALVALIGGAELALLAFAVLPPGGQVIAMFCNGLPLGAVWGLVFGFLEGRRTTELLGAGLSIPALFGLAALLNALVAIYIYGLVPEFLLRFIAWLLVKAVYRLRTEGIEHVPQEGAAVLVANHVSFVDAVVIMGASPRPIRFVMDHRIFRTPLISFIFRHTRAIPIARVTERCSGEGFEEPRATGRTATASIPSSSTRNPNPPWDFESIPTLLR